MGREEVRSKGRKEKTGTDGNRKAVASESGRVSGVRVSFILFIFCFCTVLGRFCATESRVGWG